MIEIHVTQNHIDEAKRLRLDRPKGYNICIFCPAALAARDYFNKNVIACSAYIDVLKDTENEADRYDVLSGESQIDRFTFEFDVEPWTIKLDNSRKVSRA